MTTMNIIIRRALSTVNKQKDIGEVFIQDDVQKMLKDITRFTDERLFQRRQVASLSSPKLVFMTDEQLEKARREAYEHVEARIQMPPVLHPRKDEPRVLSKDDDIVGYTKFKVMFIDISPGFTDRTRLMSIREVDGTLREPTFQERTRLNHMFYPGESRFIEEPKIFSDDNMIKVLKKGQYEHILNRACIQFEPDDPRYVEITSKVYDYINDKQHYDKLRSTRHFGPMSLYLAFNRKADDLILEMLSKDLIEDAAKLVKIFNACHNIELDERLDDYLVLKNYSDNASAKKHNLDLALQKISSPDAHQPIQLYHRHWSPVRLMQTQTAPTVKSSATKSSSYSSMFVMNHRP